MSFVVLGKITNIEVIAVGYGIRELARLNKIYGRGRWRKLKGEAKIRLHGGWALKAELHWYEAHGIGKKEMKIKQFLEEQ